MEVSGRSFEELRAPIALCKSQSKFFQEGMQLQLVKFNDKIISVKLPNTMTLKVTQCDPSVKGNTAQGVTKPATVETGAVLTVPGFIVEGELIKVNTETGEYLGRAN